MANSNQRVVGIRALGAIVLAALPTAILCLLAVAAVAIWQQRDPVGFPLRGEGVDREIINAQTVRAQQLLPSLDVLLIGDSSGLMGIDPELLSQALGEASVESLATFGFVGPRGFAAILNRFLDRGGRAARLLIVLESSSLARQKQWLKFERMATDGVAISRPPNGWLAGVRARLLSVAEPLLYVPLSGHYGDYYGTAPKLAEFIRTHHGTAIEPGPPLPLHEGRRAGVKPYRERTLVRFEMSDSFTEGLPDLAASVERFGRDKVRLVLMPQLSWFDEADTARRREAACERLRQALHLDASAVLPLPVLLPASWFASETHLSSRGRVDFTAILAQALVEDRERSGWAR